MLVFVVAEAVLAQSRLRFKRINEIQGLSSLDVLTIVEDDDGFIWFGTQDGLNRFDGIHCRVFRNESGNHSSISDNWVQIIFNDERGNLWIGTQNGLNLYDPQTMSFRHWHHDPEDSTSLSHDDIYAIASAGSGRLWIGTRGGGLNLFDVAENTFTVWTHDPSDSNSLSNNSILSILVHPDGMLFLGTEGGGLNLFNPGTEMFARIVDAENPEFTATETIIWEIIAGTEGEIWIGSGQHLSRYDYEKGSFEHWEVVSGVDRIEALYQESDNIIWYGSRGRGLVKIDLRNGYTTIDEHLEYDLNSLSHNELVEIYEDSHGLIWIGTRGGGANILDATGKGFEYFSKVIGDSNSLIDNSVRAIFEDAENKLWIGTNNGLSVLDQDQYLFRNYYFDPQNENGISHQRIRAFLQTRDGRIWVGNEGAGLSEYLKDEDRFVHYKEDVFGDIILNFRTLYEDEDGYIWIGSYTGGLIRFDPKSKKIKNWVFSADDPNGIPDSRVQLIVPHGDGRLWIGSDGGLSLFDPISEEFKTWRNDPSDPKSLINSKIRSLVKQDGVLWIGTRSGFSRFDIEHNVFENFTHANGLPSDVIFGILPDDSGGIWLTTPNGLSRFDPESRNFRNIVIPYNNHLDMGAYYKASNGDFLVGGPGGLTRFNPNEIRGNPFPPVVVFTDLEIFNRSVIEDKNINFFDELVLNYRENMLSFQFAALNFKFAERNQYAYQLEGFDKDWIYCGSRNRASYANLLPGNYRFKVKGANNDGLWNEIVTEVSVRIVPPFWMTLWFKIAIGVTILLGVVTFTQYRTYQMKQTNVLLEDKVRSRTQALLETNELLTETRDELNTTLESLQDAVISIDQSGLMMSFNRAAKEIFGADVFAGKDANIRDALNLNACGPSGGSMGSGTLHLETRIYDAELCVHQGEHGKRFLAITSSRILDRSMGVTGYVFVFRDVSKKIEMENQLALASKMESIGHLAAGMAHEINTPLQYIGTNNEFLASAVAEFKSFFEFVCTSLKPEGDSHPILERAEGSDIEFMIEESENAIGEAGKGLKSIGRIVGAMKAFGHPSMGEKSMVDINEAIETALTISRNSWKYVSNVEKDFDPELKRLYCQPDELNQVFLNLIVNAAHAIEGKVQASADHEKRGLIRVKTEQDDAWTRIIFEDSGCGIAADHHKKIFDPFFTTKSVGKGTGQGLAISHDIIVKKHDGKIEVDSIVGEGTTFTISLPRKTAKSV